MDVVENESIPIVGVWRGLEELGTLATGQVVSDSEPVSSLDVWVVCFGGRRNALVGKI